MISFYEGHCAQLNLTAVELSAVHEGYLETDGKEVPIAAISFGIHLGRFLGRVGMVAARFFNLFNRYSQNSGCKKVCLFSCSVIRLAVSPLQIAGSAFFALVSGVGNLTGSEDLRTFSQKGLRELAEIDAFFDDVEARYFDRDCLSDDIKKAEYEGLQTVIDEMEPKNRQDLMAEMKGKGRQVVMNSIKVKGFQAVIDEIRAGKNLQAAQM